MNIHSLIFAKNSSSKNDIKNHLERCNTLFKPALSSYINLNTYSKKLSERARRYEVFFKGELVGLVAIYQTEDCGFITNFSVEKDFIGKGVSSELMKSCVDDVKKQNLGIIRLEVFKENERAVKFYFKYGFIVENDNSTILTLIKIL